MRFNPPPNWPPAPPGWVPDNGWVPDPSWPPPPPGWQLWVDDSVGYPPGHQPYPLPYPPQWPPQPFPEPKPRTALWITLATVTLLALVAVAVVLNAGGRLTSAADKRPSGKSDITTLTADLLIDKAVFPESARGRWSSGVNNSAQGQPTMPNLRIDPSECADLYGDSKAATQTAAVTVSNLQSGGLHSVGVRLAITPEQRDMKEYLDKCESFTQSFEVGGRTITTDVGLEPLDVDGVPPWAVATVMTSSSSKGIRLPMSITTAAISGYYRGVLVVASSNQIQLRPKSDASIDPATADELVELFNAEVQKLEAAP